MSEITRRDFVNGTLVSAGASMLPLASTSHAVLATLTPSYYPPALTGLRGSHEGSNTHAHSMAFEGKSNWGPTTQLKEEFDLIVVGGGVSGLSAAFFYQQEHGKDTKVLILDNHDDFGGHARRNEHKIGDDTRLINGGSQSLVSPHAQSKTVLGLFRDLGVNLDRFKTAYDVDFFKRNELGAVTYFNKRGFGEDKVVRHPFCNYPWWVEDFHLGWCQMLICKPLLSILMPILEIFVISFFSSMRCSALSMPATSTFRPTLSTATATSAVDTPTISFAEYFS